MREMNTFRSTAMATLIASTLFFGGCATKKFVRGQVQPVSDRVAQVDQRTGQNSTAIEGLDRQVSRTNERVSDVDSKATAAGQAAQQANSAAQQASSAAQQAKQVADQSLSQGQELRRVIDNYDNYQMVVDQNVLFRRAQSTLTKDAKAQLDQVAQNLQGMKRYVLEVVGHTDKSGSKEYNQALSERRASAVIRYLTLNHNVPLRNIRVIGVGEEAAAAMGASTATVMPTSTAPAATTTAATMPQATAANASGAPMTAKDQRRVELKVYSIGDAAGATTGAATQTGAMNQSTMPSASVSAQR